MFMVNLISTYMESFIVIYLTVTKRMLRYLKKTLDFGIFYGKRKKKELIGYTYSDYDGDHDDKKNLFMCKLRCCIMVL